MQLSLRNAGNATANFNIAQVEANMRFGKNQPNTRRKSKFDLAPRKRSQGDRSEVENIGQNSFEALMGREVPRKYHESRDAALSVAPEEIRQFPPRALGMHNLFRGRNSFAGFRSRHPERIVQSEPSQNVDRIITKHNESRVSGSFPMALYT